MYDMLKAKVDRLARKIYFVQKKTRVLDADERTLHGGWNCCCGDRTIGLTHRAVAHPPSADRRSPCTAGRGQFPHRYKPSSLLHPYIADTSSRRAWFNACGNHNVAMCKQANCCQPTVNHLIMTTLIHCSMHAGAEPRSSWWTWWEARPASTTSSAWPAPTASRFRLGLTGKYTYGRYQNVM